jgi:hypothetical protein
VSENESISQDNQLSCRSKNNVSCGSVQNAIVCPVDTNTRDSHENLPSNWLQTWSPAELAEKQIEDPCIGPILKIKLETDVKPPKNMLPIHPVEVRWILSTFM